jgi:ABC-2 type transport system permease protein
MSMLVALGKRDLRRYFSNPTGYVFITLFILLSAAAAFWSPRFFLNSLANLDQLNALYPYLLLFFIPALSMGLWSDERKQGTDELLLTLPATEQSILLGKFLAAVGIYSVSLAVSLSHVAVLEWLGHPDGGLLVANYLGFWLIGTALIPVAMLASILTSNATIAFVFGSLLCVLPIGIGQAAGLVGGALGGGLTAFSVIPYFGDFTRGIASLDAILYFISVAVVFLFLCVSVLQQRRRESSGWLHTVIRAAALVLALSSLVVLAGRTHARLDMTAERLYSLSPGTQALVDATAADRPVLIQAFVSSDVPEPLVQTRENVLGTLREIEAREAGKVTVTIQETDPYSQQARLARERYGIVPRAVADASSGEAPREVYLGLVVTSGADEQIIPFLDAGLSPEYEIARAIRVVGRTKRKRIGIVDTDVKILGGVDYKENQPRQAWEAVQELRKQYDVVEVTPAAAADAQVDALLVILPSRMTQTELDLVLQPIRRGIPTLMLVDPLPMMNLQWAPAADLARQVDPYQPAPAARIVFGNIREALAGLGVNWVPARIAWDAFNPHPDMADLPRETVFVAAGNGNPEALNRHSPVTAGLQEVLLLYPGYLQPASATNFTFDPLLQTGRVSGSTSFFDLVVPTRAGMAINDAVAREPDHRQYVLAARTQSKKPVISDPGARPVDLITIADLDFISDNFFAIRSMAASNATFDNITFFLNAIDVLAGDESFIALRNRRGRHRTLERVEAQTRVFMDRRTREEQEAEKVARTALEEARSHLQKRVEDLNARSDLDVQTKQIMARNVEATENRQLRVLENTIQEAKDSKIRASRETMELQVGTIRARIRTLAVLLPPLPVLIFGAVIFVRRTRREHEGAAALRRLRNAV